MGSAEEVADMMKKGGKRRLPGPPEREGGWLREWWVMQHHLGVLEGTGGVERREQLRAKVRRGRMREREQGQRGGAREREGVRREREREREEREGEGERGECV